MGKYQFFRTLVLNYFEKSYRCRYKNICLNGAGKWRWVHQVNCIRVGISGFSLKVCISTLHILADVNLWGRKLLVCFFLNLFLFERWWKSFKHPWLLHHSMGIEWFYIGGIRGCFFFIGQKLPFLLVQISLSLCESGLH